MMNANASTMGRVSGCFNAKSVISKKKMNGVVVFKIILIQIVRSVTNEATI